MRVEQVFVMAIALLTVGIMGRDLKVVAGEARHPEGIVPLPWQVYLGMIWVDLWIYKLLASTA